MLLASTKLCHSPPCDAKELARPASKRLAKLLPLALLLAAGPGRQFKDVPGRPPLWRRLLPALGLLTAVPKPSLGQVLVVAVPFAALLRKFSAVRLRPRPLVARRQVVLARLSAVVALAVAAEHGTLASNVERKSGRRKAMEARVTAVCLEVVGLPSDTRAAVAPSRLGLQRPSRPSALAEVVKEPLLAGTVLGGLAARQGVARTEFVAARRPSHVLDAVPAARTGQAPRPRHNAVLGLAPTA